MLGTHETLQSQDIAAATKTSRQAIHRHLRRMVDTGELVAEGAGRGTRYRRASSLTKRLSLAGLAEDRVWTETAEPAFQRLGRLSTKASSALHYAFTELLNNAIEHAAGSTVELLFEKVQDRVAFEIKDDGIGVFARLRRGLHLPDDLAAVQELSKGKATTMPERHTGEGIFFSSKIADLFVLESGGLQWTVDNVMDDMALGEAAARSGTRVRFEIARSTKRDLQKLFEAFTDDFAFSKTKTTVKLFDYGVRFISRSEARRLVLRLEQFQEVVLDFRGVVALGQGFADEVFRVWHKKHTEVRLVPIRMTKPVAFLVERARHAGQSPS